jgi:hypothetical protein
VAVRQKVGGVGKVISLGSNLKGISINLPTMIGKEKLLPVGIKSEPLRARPGFQN